MSIMFLPIYRKFRFQVAGTVVLVQRPLEPSSNSVVKNSRACLTTVRCVAACSFACSYMYYATFAMH